MDVKALRDEIAGKSANVPVGQILFDVTIKDIRYAYGRIDALLSPVSGSGETWIELKNLRNIGKPPR